MEYRELGCSGMRVSRLALGCFAFAGDRSTGSHLGQAMACFPSSSVCSDTSTQAMTALHAHVWGPQNDDDTFACVRRALQLGVNFFDTAEMCVAAAHAKSPCKRPPTLLQVW